MKRFIINMVARVLGIAIGIALTLSVAYLFDLI